MSSDLNLPTKPCHNCKKRRWKCDRSLPVCQKCIHSGAECLGYGKLLVWNHGVARRGKMMGRSFEDLDKTKMEGQEQLLQLSTKITRNPEDPSHSSSSESTGSSPGSESSENGAAVQWTLIDPLVKDLNRQSRYYLYHFATHLCTEYVVHDGPGRNPIKDLVPATSNNPLLLQVMIANSAVHVHNLSSELFKPATLQFDRKPNLVAYYSGATRFGGPFNTSYRDALVAKQNGLSLLAQAVVSVNQFNVDLVLVSILLFINYDLIESGRDKWKVHMEGARRLITLFGTPEFRQQPMGQLRIALLSDFLVFYVLGMTLSFTTGEGRLIPASIDLSPILHWAETNNYLSCPGPLLEIMLRSFDLPDTRECGDESTTAPVQHQVRELLEAALLFDPVHWACTFEPATPSDDLGKRVRIASAHRAAVCIYVARVLPAGNPLIDSSCGTALICLASLADEVVDNIAQLTPKDAVFKSISWPLFLAGAESQKPAQRLWILETLDTLWNEMYWGYIRTVRNVLEAIWKRRDQAPRTDDDCWVDDVKSLGTEVLIA
ncbi:hypothetical protein EJ04DRAFT_425235 [Polyplosphaeria fusca]|uniref:Zn(2)-C6 fungal-type domain-containing protein n=1 Tax=Polyplosphaeria fusca TaxID=682080 RepID=A0A9P4R746_9PLEO|nr:hypothetical protein EJ04DRAFT_425235 [Polyplosphaeria fusca]